MARPVDLRLGTAADTRLIAEYMLLAGGGLFEQLLDDIVPGIGAQPLLALALAINQADGPLGWDNAVVAEVDGEAAGMVLAFPAADYRLPEAVTAFVPARRLHRIEALIASCLPESFYIQSLAVVPTYRRLGIARALLGVAAEMAAAQGYRMVTLHAWNGNTDAMAFYRSFGFRMVDEVAIKPAARLTWAGPVSVMAADTAALLTAPTQAMRAARNPL